MGGRVQREQAMACFDDAIIDRLSYLCREVLEPVKDAVGVSIEVVSGYRSLAVSEAYGVLGNYKAGEGSKAHGLGLAVDVRVPDVVAYPEHVENEIIDKFASNTGKLYEFLVRNVNRFRVSVLAKRVDVELGIVWVHLQCPDKGIGVWSPRIF